MDLLRILTLISNPNKAYQVLPTPMGKFYLINSPILVRKILSDKNRHYRKGNHINMLRKILGDSPFTSHGEIWKSGRKASAQVFQPAPLEAESENFRKIVLSHLNSVKETEPLPHEFFSLTSLHLVSAATLGAIARSDLDEIVKIMLQIAQELDRSTKPLRAIYIFNSKKNPFALVRERLMEIIKPWFEHPDLSTNNKLISQLKLIDRPLEWKIDVIIGYVFAGQETLANTFYWQHYILAHYPEVVKNLHASLASHDDSYLEACVNETLRLFPPAWLLWRINGEEDVHSELTIPKESNIIVSPYLLHRHQNYWKNPHDFSPERFLEASDPGISSAFIPYGFGPRICSGERPAQIFMKIFMRETVKNLSVHFEGKEKLKLRASITLKPKSPGKLFLRRIS